MQTFFHSIAIGFTAIILAISGFFAGHAPVQAQPVGAVIPTAVALFETSLATAITSSATTMSLTSAVDKAGTTFASSTYAFVLDSGTTAEEMVLANCTGASCTGMTRGISPITGTSTVASLQFAHRRGASVKITDGPQLLILSRILNGQDTLPNKLIYGSAPTFVYGNNELVTWDKSRDYTNSVAIAGAPIASDSILGISKLSVVAASTTNPIVVGDNDTRVPTVNQTAALVGTSGTGASSTNKFVDNNDTSGTGLIMRSSKINAPLFGDGSDGDVVISANSTTTRDMYYHNLTINTGITLATAGFKVFVSGTLTQVGTGKFANNADGSGGGTEGTLEGGINGVSGGVGGTGQSNGTGNSGTAGTANPSIASITNPTPSSVAGGTGGDCGRTYSSGGTPGGSVTGTVVSAKVLLNYFTGVYQQFAAYANGSFKHLEYHAGNGSGGGGVGGSGTGGAIGGNGGNGGASGGNGGIVAIFANTIVTASNPIASVIGGNGANGSVGGNSQINNGDGGGGGGGGAGGNGGLVYIAYLSLTGSLSATLTAGTAGSGGAGGLKQGSGLNGATGTAGTAGLSGLLVTVAL